MVEQIIQASFNSGEWSPKLYARVDQVKYRSGAALLQNFFVDYRGGASTRPGTRFIARTPFTSQVRLIPFQASFTTDYVLEFGNGYIRFYTNGAPVTEAATTITGVTKANPGVATDVAHGYNNGNTIIINNIVGMTQLNGGTYLVANVTTDTYTLTDLDGNAIDTTTYSTYVSGGTASRVYTIGSPYLSGELSQIKYAQNVAQLIICHPNHVPMVLTLISPANWTLAAITFGSTVTAPIGQSVASTLGAGSANYAYVITAVDSIGQESAPSAFATLSGKLDIRNTAGTNTVSWSAVTGAVSYNVYRAQINYAGPVPAGSQFGFIGTCSGTNFVDANIGPDFSQTPPVPQNPFSGAGVASVTVTAKGGCTIFPAVVFSASPGQTAQGICTVEANGVTIAAGGSGWFGGVGALIYLANGVILQVLSVDGLGGVNAVAFANRGSFIGSAGAPLGSGPYPQLATNFPSGTSFSAVLNWRVNSAQVSNPGSGYLAAPSVSFTNSPSTTAVAVLGAASSGNPTVPGFFQQRLVLAGPVGSPQQFNMSKPGASFNFDVAQITLPNDAIQGTLVSGKLNTIEAMVAQPQGLIVLSDQQSWLINGGSAGAPISTTALVANSQSFNGAGGPPPVVATNNIIFVQAKGSIVRDMAFSIYTSVYSGVDISVLASHLFYGYQILEWAWAEEPFKLLWAVRSDGVLLSLTYLKEQEYIAWTHHTTTGSFKSIATVVEATSTAGNVDAIYFVVQRTINGNTVQYIERLAERSFPNGLASAWTVDAAINYTGSPVLTFSGAIHLNGATVTGLATDDQGNTTVITPFIMPATGVFTLPAPPAPATGYTGVTVGLGFTCQLQTLPLEIGEPTVQGKVKKINDVVVRVADTLGLFIGPDFNHLTPMKDLVVGNVSSMLTGQNTSQVITNLVTGDAITYLTAGYTVPGQYCIQQSQPYPATILGVIPNVTIGDGGRR